ncbi:MAG: aspartate aminotransferase family protein [Candidatus Puniceispirillaceae bacterium]
MTEHNPMQELADRARAVLPAGGFGNFDADVFIRSGHGSRVIDENGEEFIDYLISSGPMILGHGHPEVNAAVHEQIDRGMTFFANNAAGVELAEVICEAVPCADQLRYVSTGGEADMYAMRLARAHTGRSKILKFEGGYHGMSAEALMSLAPSRLQNFPQPVPDSAGIPDSVEDGILVAPFNDSDFAESLISEHADDIAGVIVEPLQRLIPPAPGFLQALRDLTTKHGIVLIFDEVVTGFRLAWGGAQEAYGVTPDLCTLGKIIGGGLPLAAIAGREDIMRHFDKAAVGEEGFTFQIGTLSGNPLASVAGLKTLEVLRRPQSYETLYAYGERLMAAMSDPLTAHGIPHQIVGAPGLFDVVFTGDPVLNYRDMMKGDKARAATFNAAVREKGILKPGAKLYPHLALSEEDLQQTEAAFTYAAEQVAAKDNAA